MHAGLYCVYGPKADGRDFHIIPSHKHATRSHWQVVKAAQIRNFNISYFVFIIFYGTYQKPMALYMLNQL